MKAQLICTNCDPISSRRRSNRSAATPAKSASVKIGNSPKKESSPNQKGEPPSSKTSQLWASFCIHVPMLEVQAPDHMSRKSRD